MGNDNSKVLEKLDEMQTTLDRLDLRSAAFVERAYRQDNAPCESVQVISVGDAVGLLTKDFSAGGRLVDKLVQELYKKGTRRLLKLICPDADITEGETEEQAWENKAYKALMDKQEELNQEQTPSEDTPSQKAIIAAFISLLKPLCDVKDKKKGKAAHEHAVRTLREDTSGLALSMIMAHKSVQQFRLYKSWAWLVLDIDGYTLSRNELNQEVRIVTEVKSSSASKYKSHEQLIIRAGFLDALFDMTKYSPIMSNRAAESSASVSPGSVASEPSSEETKVQITLVSALMVNPLEQTLQQDPKRVKLENGQSFQRIEIPLISTKKYFRI